MIEKLHPLLARQLKKNQFDFSFDNEKYFNLFQHINDSYHSFDRDRELFEHSSRLNDKEYHLINTKLKSEMILKNEFVSRIKEAILKLANKNVEVDISLYEDLLKLTDILNEQIVKQKLIEEELKEAKQSAEDANIAKSDFLSMMSHEIRTPLNAIVGLSYLMLQEKDTDVLNEHLKTLQFSTNNLHVLINDILDFSKIEAGKVELEKIPFDFNILLQNIKKANEVMAAEKGIKLNLIVDERIPNVLIGDQLRIGQIITNLVSNGIKFTNVGSVTLKNELIEEDLSNITVKITVSDTGIGIEKDKFKLIFDKFQQAAHGTTREYGGSGLGLVITKKLLELYNSTITLDSKLGIGSTFSFIISFPKSSEFIKPNQIDNTFQSDRNFITGKKVLLVEDYPVNILVAKKFLENWGLIVDVAEDGEKALKAFEVGKYDLILMDLQMPILDGYNATIEIRKLDTKVPIIALTASATFSNQDRALNLGMNDYITKPFNPNDFLYKIKKVLVS